MKYAFWGLSPIEGVVTEVGGEVITPVDINDLPAVYPEFTIVKDDTEADVLLVESANAVSLKVNDIVYIPTAPEWFGGIPIKPK